MASKGHLDTRNTDASYTRVAQNYRLQDCLVLAPFPSFLGLWLGHWKWNSNEVEELEPFEPREFIGDHAIELVGS